VILRDPIRQLTSNAMMLNQPGRGHPVPVPVPVPVPDLSGDGDGASVPDLRSGAGTLVPDLSGIGDSPPSPSPIC
jgi:hypothetical protein